MNGGVWVWPLIFYVRNGFQMMGDDFVTSAREIAEAFNEDIQTCCIGSLSEYYDADPPYGPRGATSSALSVGALLQICDMIARHSKKARTTKSTAKAAEKKPAKAGGTAAEASAEKKTAARKPAKAGAKAAAAPKASTKKNNNKKQ